jgi:succinate dehydrogenase / fumarate reductase membrane anchor subunit
MKIKIRKSVKHGSQHWIFQRVSAIILIPLIVWFSVSVIKLSSDSFLNIKDFFSSPVNLILSLLIINTAIYHGSLGVRVVFEDYIAKKSIRHIAIYLINAISIITSITLTISLIKLHLIG